MEFAFQFIKAENIIIISVLYILGLILKRSKTIPNQFIPLILTVLGILFAGIRAFAVYWQYPNIYAAVFDAITQGIICSGMAIYAYEFIKNIKK